MPRTKKGPGRGRPVRPLPPKIDATPERIAEVVLGVRPKRKFTDPPATRDYRCQDCGQVVKYPDTLHEDGRCRPCHTAQAKAGS